MGKLLTYIRYFLDYIRHGDFLSVLASMRYIVFKKSHKSDRIIRTKTGSFFCRRNTNDFQFANYFYEWEVKKFLLKNKETYNVFIDGGACTGECCVLLSKHNIKCIAFEPIGFSYDVLLRNLKLNHCNGHVKAHQFGLGDKNEQVGFVFNPVNTGASHRAEPGQKSDCMVDIRSFDSLLPHLGIKKEDHILFKLDVEGMETLALQGAEKFIREYPNITFVMEDKHAGEVKIKNTLNSMANFEYGIVDEYNIYAKKQNIT